LDHLGKYPVRFGRQRGKLHIRSVAESTAPMVLLTPRRLLHFNHSGDFMDVFDKLLKGVAKWRPLLGLGIALVAVGLAYLLHFQSDLDRYVPIDTYVNRLQFNQFWFGLSCLITGSLVCVVETFLYMTDLNRSPLSGEYYSELSYDGNEMNRVISGVLGPTHAADQSLAKDSNGALRFDPVINAALMKRLDSELVGRLKFGPRWDRSFYEDFSNLRTELRMFISFKSDSQNSTVFEFDGFGIITDKDRHGREANCAVVIHKSANAMHNYLRISSLWQRAKLLISGAVVTLEMQQLIDPFSRLSRFRFLLKFCVRRRLLRWDISEGIFFLWNPETETFFPSNCAHNISIVK
jgi:hypothetical protein